MTQSKHTPGPWTLNFDHPTLSTIAYVRAPSRPWPLEVTVIYNADKRDVYSENTANAHLIAAAPELLEALEVALEAGHLPAAIRKEAEKAIAKARGK